MLTLNLKAPRFQILIVKNDSSAFNLKPFLFFSELAPLLTTRAFQKTNYYLWSGSSSKPLVRRCRLTHQVDPGLKALWFQPVESTSLSKLWFQMSTCTPTARRRARRTTRWGAEVQADCICIVCTPVCVIEGGGAS